MLNRNRKKERFYNAKKFNKIFKSIKKNTIGSSKKHRKKNKQEGEDFNPFDEDDLANFKIVENPKLKKIESYNERDSTNEFTAIDAGDLLEGDNLYTEEDWVYFLNLKSEKANKFTKSDLKDSLRFKSIVKQGVPAKFRPHFYSIFTSTCYVF